jgi:uncharacterized protein (TIGR02466 family)
MNELSIFATTLYVDKQNCIPSIESIKNLHSTDSGVTISNRIGYQSHSYVYESLDFMKPCIDEILVKLTSIYYEFGLYVEQPCLTNYWFNINHKGSYNTSHNHPRSFFSAVLYIKVPENSGAIVFDRPDMLKDYIVPSINTPKNFRSWTITPEDNLLLIFPSYLYHHVESNMSDDERISVAFNFN